MKGIINFLLPLHQTETYISYFMYLYVAFQIIGKYLLLFNYLLFNILREYDDS
jgi:hypothetical protein